MSENDAPRENPFETPSPRGIRVVQATLRVVFAIQCWGYAAGELHHQRGFALLDMLQLSRDLAAQDLAQLETSVSYVLIGAGVLTLFRPSWLILLPAAVWQTGMALAPIVLNQGRLPFLEPAEQATRWIVPIALLLIDFWPPNVKPTLTFSLISVGLLRLAAIATFVAHGLAACYQFQHGGSFVELITLSAEKLIDRTVPPEQAQQSLAVIGIVDIAVGLGLLTSRNRVLVGWMVLWGLVTAASRTVAYGVEGYDQTLIRFANAGVPLTVLMFWINAFREQKPIILPDDE